MAEWWAKVTNQKNDQEQIKTYDYVIMGGGIAGCANAIAAVEQGLKVALIHDRPEMPVLRLEYIRWAYTGTLSAY